MSDRFWESWKTFSWRARKRVAQQLSPGVRHPVTVTRPDGHLGVRQAVVVGSSGFLGSALVATLAEAGIDVWAFDRTPPGSAVDGVRNVEGDLTVADDVRRFAESITSAVGGEPTPLAVFEVAGGMGTFKRGIRGADPDVWLDRYEADVVGPVHVIQCLLPVLGRGSSITFICSADVFLSSPWPHYGATKAAQAKVVVSLASELAPDGIRVNGVAASQFTPGFVTESPFIPLGGHGIPLEAVVQAVLFLADPGRSPMTTGAILPVDGGLSLEDARISAWRGARFGR